MRSPEDMLDALRDPKVWEKITKGEQEFLTSIVDKVDTYKSLPERQETRLHLIWLRYAQ
jgi:hypothetical protein